MIRVFGSKLYISVFALMIAAILVFSVDATFFYIAIAGALIHELAHVAAMKKLGAKILRIFVYPFGADIKADTSQLSYRAEMVVAAAGPAASFLLSLLSYIIYSRTDMVLFLAAALSNFVFFAVNILPVRGLDGGRILISVLMLHCSDEHAYKLYDMISTAAFGFLCLLSLVFLYLSGYNISLVFVCAYLFISGYTKQKCI